MDLDSSAVIVVDPAANQNMKALTFLQKIHLANKQKWHYNNIWVYNLRYINKDRGMEVGMAMLSMGTPKSEVIVRFFLCW